MQIPSRFVAKCELGGEELDTRAEGVHQWTSGWVMQRSGGGGHGVSLPVRSNRWACRYHVERVSKGYAEQQALFG